MKLNFNKISLLKLSCENIAKKYIIKFNKIFQNASVIKLRSTLNNVLQPVTSIFVGTSPELEMALYTICFYTRPMALCPVSLGGSQFSIIVNRVNYFGKEILVSAYPEI